MSELNPVRLQAEVLDLRTSLDALQTKYAKAQLELTQKQKTSLEESVPKSEFDRLERDLFASLKREADLVAALQESKRATNDRDSLCTALQDEIANLRQHNERLAAVAAHVSDAERTSRSSSIATDVPDLALLKRQLIDSQKKIKAQTLVIDELNEALLRATVPASPIAPPAGPPPDDAAAASAFDAAADVMSLQLEIVELKERFEKISAERDDAVKSRQQATMQAQIAERVKHAALVECSEARCKGQKVETECISLREQLDTLTVQLARQQASVASHQSEDIGLRVTPAEMDGLRESLRQAQAESMRSNMLATQLRVRCDAAEDRVAELELQVTRSDQARQTAEDAGRELSKRSALALAELAQHSKGDGNRNERQLERLMSKYKDDRSSIQAIFATVVDRYESLIQGLGQDVGGSSEPIPQKDRVSNLMWDFICDYERKIWNLNNDLKSLKTVRELREKDTEAVVSQRFESVIESFQSQLEILRLQVRELGGRPAC